MYTGVHRGTPATSTLPLVSWVPDETRREPLRVTFESAADRYDAARPEYPPELFDDLDLADPTRDGARLLEIGCATGKATRPLLERGFRVVCVESARSSPSARATNSPACRSRSTSRRSRSGAASRGGFDLVFAATAWHWVDPAVRYVKAHRLLRAGGHLAFWSAVHAYPEGFDPFFTEIQDVYEEIGESYEGDWPPSRPTAYATTPRRSKRAACSRTCRCGATCGHGTTTRTSTSRCSTRSRGTSRMPPERRERLYDEIRRRLALRDDPRVLRHWFAILHVARRRT